MAGRTVGQAIIEIIADAGKFNDALERESARIGDGFGASVNSAIGGALVTGAKVTGAAVAGVLSLSLVQGFQRLTAIDNARAKLTGLGHDAGTVETIMNAALASVKGTAFGMGDAASLAAIMVGAGIKPGQDLQRVLGLVGDTATIAGTGLKDMGVVWGQVAAKGRLQGDEMLQMMERGIPVLQLLADHYGLTSAEVSKMVTDGKVSFADFAAAMEKGMGGAALTSGRTFEGALKNVGAALSRLGASFLGSAFEKMPALFADVTAKLDQMGPAAETLGSALGSGLEVAVGAVSRLGGAISATVGFFQQNDVALKILLTSLGLVAVALGVTMVVALAQSAAALVANVAAWFVMAAASRGAGLSASFTAAQIVTGWVMMGAAAVANAAKVAAGWVLMGVQAMAAGVRMAAAWVIGLGPIAWIAAAVIALAVLIALNWDRISAAIGAAWEVVKAKTAEVWASITAFLSGVWASITGAASSAWAGITAAASNMWSGITSGVSSAWAAVTGFVSSVASAIAGFVAGVVAMGVRLLDAITLPWRWALAIVLTLALALWTNAVQPAVDAIVNGVRAGFTMLSSIVSSAMSVVSSVMSTVWNAVTSVVSSAWNAVTSAVSSAMSSIGSAVSTGWNAVRSVVSSAMSSIGSAVSTGFNAVRSVVQSAMSAVQSVVSSAWNAVTSVISSAISRVQSVVSAGFNAVRSVVQSVLGTLGGIAQSAMNAVVSAISGAVGAARGAASAVGEGIKGAFSAIVEKMASIGSSIVNGVADGIRGAIGAVKSAAAAVADAVPGPIKSLLGIASPSRVTRGLGRETGEGLELGLLDRVGSVGAAAGRLTSAALGGLSGPFGVPGVGPVRAGGVAGGALAAVSGGGGVTNVYVSVSVDDLERMGSVAQFVDMLGGARARERQVARSGFVTV